jgi:hypothetical protein
VPERYFTIDAIEADLKDVLQIRPSKQDKVTLFYLKPFIYRLSRDVALNLSNSKTVFATHPTVRCNAGELMVGHPEVNRYRLWTIYGLTVY